MALRPVKELGSNSIRAALRLLLDSIKTIRAWHQLLSEFLTENRRLTKKGRLAECRLAENGRLAKKGAQLAEFCDSQSAVGRNSSESAIIRGDRLPAGQSVLLAESGQRLFQVSVLWTLVDVG